MPYPVKGFLEIYEDMVQILLMLEVLLVQDFMSMSSSIRPISGANSPPIDA